MIERRIKAQVREALDRQAAVALIGPRQVGKTTLAHELAGERDALYLDLEDRNDRAKLSEPALFLEQYEDKLVVLDEIHRTVKESQVFLAKFTRFQHANVAKTIHF